MVVIDQHTENITSLHKDSGESGAQTSPPNQNPPSANVPSAKDNTKPLPANSVKN